MWSSAVLLKPFEVPSKLSLLIFTRVYVNDTIRPPTHHLDGRAPSFSFACTPENAIAQTVHIPLSCSFIFSQQVNGSVCSTLALSWLRGRKENTPKVWRYSWWSSMSIFLAKESILTVNFINYGDSESPNLNDNRTILCSVPLIKVLDELLKTDVKLTFFCEVRGYRYIVFNHSNFILHFL